MEGFFMNIYERIKSISDNKHLTISTIEAECNISNGSISKWKSQIPKADSLYSVAKFLNTSIEYLLTGKDNNTYIETNQDWFIIINGQKHKVSVEAVEIIKIYESLDARARNKFFNFVLKLEKEMKEKESNKEK